MLVLVEVEGGGQAWRVSGHHVRRLAAERRIGRGSVREPEEAELSRLVDSPETIVHRQIRRAVWGCSLANGEDGEDGGGLGMDITDREMWDKKWWEWECVKMRVAVLQ